MTTQQQQIMEEALSETGIVPFYEGDVSLVSNLCEIIGDLHRQRDALLAACQALLQDAALGCFDHVSQAQAAIALTQKEEA